MTETLLFSPFRRAKAPNSAQTRVGIPLLLQMVMNLANALWRLGERESGTGRLEEAVLGHRLALKEWTRERVPLDWAGAQMNLANVLSMLGARNADLSLLADAEAILHEARTFAAEGGHEPLVDYADEVLAEVAAIKSGFVPAKGRNAT